MSRLALSHKGAERMTSGAREPSAFDRHRTLAGQKGEQNLYAFGRARREDTSQEAREGAVQDTHFCPGREVRFGQDDAPGVTAGSQGGHETLREQRGPARGAQKSRNPARRPNRACRGVRRVECDEDITRKERLEGGPEPVVAAQLDLALWQKGVKALALQMGQGQCRALRFELCRKP